MAPNSSAAPNARTASGASYSRHSTRALLRDRPSHSLIHRVWDPRDWTCAAKWPHASPLLCLESSSNSAFVAGGQDYSVSLWRDDPRSKPIPAEGTTNGSTPTTRERSQAREPRTSNEEDHIRAEARQAGANGGDDRLSRFLPFNQCKGV